MLRIEHIYKSFPGIIANNNISLNIKRGEIRCLLGENGSGKTTLVNILSGLYKPDSGRIFLENEELTVYSPRLSIEKGISTVHQHFKLVQELTVTENIILGLRLGFTPFLDKKSYEESITRLSENYNLKVDPREMIWRLPVGMQQRVELLKALYRKPHVLILDEPTTVLTPNEITDLFSLLKQLAKEGLSIIFITHKLKEALEIGDNITVLRDGIIVNTVGVHKADYQKIAFMMVGREVAINIQKMPLKKGKNILEVKQLYAYNDRRQVTLKDISFTIKKGEIFGLIGVDGNGQRELIEVITGFRKAHSGKIFISGVDVTNFSASQINIMKVGYIPEDRQKLGLIMDMSLCDNFILKKLTNPQFSKNCFLKFQSIKKETEKIVKEYDIRTTNISRKVRTLSGGNQQKIILARELSMGPKLMIAAQATRGLDIGAAEYVHKTLIKQRNQGLAILYVSTELEEVLTISDRIAVIFNGEIMGIGDPKDIDIKDIGLMMAGYKYSNRYLNLLNNCMEVYYKYLNIRLE